MSINVIGDNQSVAATQATIPNDATSVPALITFLVLFFITSIVGNCALIAALAKRPKNCSTFNIFIINAAIVDLLDAILNHILILSFVMGSNLGSTACRANATGLQLASIVRLLTLFLLTIDRHMAISDNSNFITGMGRLAALVLTVYVWLQGFAFSLPLMFTVLSVSLQSVSYHCTLGQNTSLAYLCLTSAICYFLPFVVIIVLFALIYKTYVTITKRKDQTTILSEEELFLQKLLIEIAVAKYVFSAFICWILFDAPFLILYATEQYATNSEVQEQYNSTNYTNTIDMPQHIELTFTWFRLSSPIYLPILYLMWKKNVWRKMTDNCQSNMHNANEQDHTRLEGAQGGSVSPSVTNSSIPVLFATVDGLHIQTRSSSVEDDHSKPLWDVSSFNSRNQLHAEVENTPRHNYVSTKCDVFGSQPDFSDRPNSTIKNNERSNNKKGIPAKSTRYKVKNKTQGMTPEFEQSDKIQQSQTVILQQRLTGLVDNNNIDNNILETLARDETLNSDTSYGNTYLNIASFQSTNIGDVDQKLETNSLGQNTVKVKTNKKKVNKKRKDLDFSKTSALESLSISTNNNRGAKEERQLPELFLPQTRLELYENRNEQIRISEDSAQNPNRVLSSLAADKKSINKQISRTSTHSIANNDIMMSDIDDSAFHHTNSLDIFTADSQLVDDKLSSSETYSTKSN